MPSKPQLLVASTLLSLTTIILYIKHKHSTFESKITRQKVSHHERVASHRAGNLHTLPTSFLHDADTSPDKLPLIHEKCSLPIPTYNPCTRPNRKEDFTLLLRHNMTLFASLPQAWLFYLLFPHVRYTFTKHHISNLAFRPGDLVCGVYRVVKRDDIRAEMAMELPAKFGSVGGLLVVRIEEIEGEGNGVVSVTETLQWVEGGKGSVGDLPLAKAVPKFLHEVASAWLLVSGGEFLGGRV